MSASNPLILITNDDGVRSIGLELLAAALAQVSDVLVAAPAEEQSAVGHGITLSRPLRIYTVRPGWYAVSGTPADSILLALSQICPERPSLVVSGINLGLNLGTDVFYSGTVAGAVEGALRGVQSMAVSQELPDPGGPSLEELLARTARFAAGLARHLLEAPLPERMALNVNAPADTSIGFACTSQGRRVYREIVDRRLDLRGQPYFWIGGPALRNMSPPGTDAHAVESGLIAVTPLGLDLTVRDASCYDVIEMEGFERVEVEPPQPSDAPRESLLEERGPSR